MMKRVLAVLACGASLSACASMNLPSFDMSGFKSAPPTASVRVESEPAGAEARAPSGPGCRTPCTLTLPASGTTLVSFSLQGYLPYSIPVTVTSLRETGNLFDAGGDGVGIDPNPVFAALEIAPPPPPVRRKPAPPKKKPRPKPAPAAEAAPPPPPPQQQQPGFGPPAGAPPQPVFR